MGNYCYRCMKPITDGRPCSCGFDNSRINVEEYHIYPGSILQGRYLVGCALGEGGFGITYVGLDTLLDIKVAIKEFYPTGYATRNNSYSMDVVSGTGDRGRFYNQNMDKFIFEGRTMAKFDDVDGIVKIKDCFKDNNTAYIVMEYLEGETLRKHCNRTGPLPYPELIKIMTPVLIALARLHEQSVVHRDVSPDNIMMLKNGKVKILDFGAAREFDMDETRSMSVIIKQGFAPEEQYRTKGKQGPWTDIYSVAASMYYCLTGKLPPNSIDRLSNDTIIPIGEYVPSLRQDYCDAIMTAMAVRSEYRYQSIEEFMVALGLDVLGLSSDDGSVYSEKIKELDYLKKPEKKSQKIYSGILLGMIITGATTIVGMIIYLIISLFI